MTVKVHHTFYRCVFVLLILSDLSTNFSPISVDVSQTSPLKRLSLYQTIPNIKYYFSSDYQPLHIMFVVNFLDNLKLLVVAVSGGM